MRSTAGRSYFYASDIAEFEKYRYELDDAIKAGDVEPAFVIFRRFQQRSRERMNYAIELLAEETGFRRRRILQFRPRKGTLAGERRRDERAVAQARQERCAVADDRRQAVAGSRPTSCASATSTSRSAWIRASREDVFEAFMNAFVLSLDPHSNYFSRAQLRGIQHPDEPLSYEGIGASLQLTDDYVTVIDVIAGGPAAVSRQARRQRSHHRGRRRQDRRAHRRDRLAPRRRGAEDPRPGRHAGAPAAAARRRCARLGAEGGRVHAQPGVARGAGRAQGDADRRSATAATSRSASSPSRASIRTTTPAAPAPRTIAAPRATCSG